MSDFWLIITCQTTIQVVVIGGVLAYTEHRANRRNRP